MLIFILMSFNGLALLTEQIFGQDGAQTHIRVSGSLGISPCSSWHILVLEDEDVYMVRTPTKLDVIWIPTRKQYSTAFRSAGWGPVYEKATGVW
jgi:hypothetical protein